MLNKLGFPFSLEKLEGPITRIVFLGILFDSIAMTLSLDDERLADLRALLLGWKGKKTGSRKELQSLVGKLNFASSVVKSGRIFFRSILEQLKRISPTANADTQHPLNEDFFRDVNWWLTFASEWNGVSLIPPHPASKPSIIIDTDACQKGYGAVFVNGEHWLAGQWTPDELSAATRTETLSMPWLELRAVAIAAATWGKTWKGQRVLVRSDCKAAVDVWMNESSTNVQMTDLVRSILFLAALHDFHLSIIHIPGADNMFADWLSRDQVTRFLESLALHSRSPTTPLPPPVHAW